MNHSPYPVVLDACVIYPSLLRDLLMHLGLTGLYQPKWTVQIQEEWQRNLLLNNADVTMDKLRNIEHLMNKALPDANVTGFEQLIPALVLPDADDRHVLAAAIRANAEVIVTANLKDFPATALFEFGVEAMHPDEFIADLFDLNSALVLKAVRTSRTAFRKPPFDVDEYLDCLLRQGLPMTVKELDAYRSLI
ncbi:PIN domain-containing protein [Pectobacterium carotovorum]|uniref:PIN domain-containing protein n=1 Tax=Pectobacterium carotovorum TaxID=554 RepID=UPI00301AE711